MQYTMVLPVRHVRLENGRAAVESAFAAHLRMLHGRLKTHLGELQSSHSTEADLDELILNIASPALTQDVYFSQPGRWEVIDESEERIIFHSLFYDHEVSSPISRIRCWRRIKPVLAQLTKMSVCIHSGFSFDPFLPFEFGALRMGVRFKRKTVFVVDIDYRNSARMNLITGAWSKKSYMVTRYFYDVLRAMQLRYAASNCSLLLLKGKQLVRDFGKGKPHVRNILDAAHSSENLIDTESLSRKQSVILDKSAPIRAVYFGRLTGYKGIDRMIRAVHQARQSGANVTLDIIGGGEQEAELHALIEKLGVANSVAMHPAMSFNQDFFKYLYQYHLLLAAPLSEDTPRSALDAMAAGIPYLAFDTYYYRDLLESGAGTVVPWPDEQAIAKMLLQLDAQRSNLATMCEKASNFARRNTQEIWLERRLFWTFPRAGQANQKGD